MKKINTDVLIVGSGMTGLVSAYAISSLGFNTIITDKKEIIKPISGGFKDTRTTAISEGSKIFFDNIGLWKKISPFAEPIKKIKVIDRKPSTKINFANSDRGKNLGYIVKNINLIKVLKQTIKTKKNINLLEGSKLTSINYENDKAAGIFEKYKINADLIIAADGKMSTTRNILRAPIFKKKYSESALVVTFNHLLSHNNTAYEIFYKSGPLAMLPMKKQNMKNQSTLIWSNNPNYLKALLKQNNDFFINILNQKISKYLGPILKINSKQIFPLSSHINDKFYDKRILFLGDSAHSFHPIAGQGWNLGIRDIKNLYNLAKYNLSLGLSLGSHQFCKEYNKTCYYDAFKLYQITDKLNSIFKKDKSIHSLFRGIGFDIIENNNYLKKIITNYAMGIN